MRTPLLALLVAGALFAGCLQPPDDASPEGPRNAGGEMTAKETTEESVTLCSQGVLPSAEFCAERIVQVTGTIAGISLMDVDLSTFNGPVVLQGGADGAWSLSVVLKARGATEAAARTNLDRIEFAWGHVEGGTHFLVAKADVPDGARNSESVSLNATLPASMTLVVVASTSNGAVTVDGVRTDGLAVATSNGAVDLDADVTSVHVGTSNGRVSGTLRPYADGRVDVGTSNGAIELRVPEDGEHGYDVTASTSNGDVDIALKDGKTGECPAGSQYYTPPCNHRTFRSDRFESRDVRTQVTLATSNGAIKLAPS